MRPSAKLGSHGLSKRRHESTAASREDDGRCEKRSRTDAPHSGRDLGRETPGEAEPPRRQRGEKTVPFARAHLSEPCAPCRTDTHRGTDRGSTADGHVPSRSRGRQGGEREGEKGEEQEERTGGGPEGDEDPGGDDDDDGDGYDAASVDGRGPLALSPSDPSGTRLGAEERVALLLASCIAGESTLKESASLILATAREELEAREKECLERERRLALEESEAQGVREVLLFTESRVNLIYARKGRRKAHLVGLVNHLIDRLEEIGGLSDKALREIRERRNELAPAATRFGLRHPQGGVNPIAPASGRSDETDAGDASKAASAVDDIGDMGAIGSVGEADEGTTWAGSSGSTQGQVKATGATDAVASTAMPKEGRDATEAGLLAHPTRNFSAEGGEHEQWVAEPSVPRSHDEIDPLLTFDPQDTPQAGDVRGFPPGAQAPLAAGKGEGRERRWHVDAGDRDPTNGYSAEEEEGMASARDDRERLRSDTEGEGSRFEIGPNDGIEGVGSGDARVEVASGRGGAGGVGGGGTSVEAARGGCENRRGPSTPAGDALGSTARPPMTYTDFGNATRETATVPSTAPVRLTGMVGSSWLWKDWQG